MQFQQDCPKDKEIKALSIFLGKTEKFRSTEHYGAALEGSTIFLCPSSLGSMAMESCRLPELKYAIFSRARRKSKKLPLSKLFLSMAFKHGLLEESTFLFLYSYIAHTKLESSHLGELKNAVSAGYDVRLQNEGLRKGKNRHCATSVHGHCSMGCQMDRHFFDTATPARHRWIALD